MPVSEKFGDKYSGSIGIAPQQLLSDVGGAAVATGNNAKGKIEVHKSSTAPIAKARSRAPDLTADERHAVLSSYLEQPDALGDVFVPVRKRCRGQSPWYLTEYVGFSLSSASLQLSKTSPSKREQQSLRLFQKVARLFSPYFVACVQLVLVPHDVHSPAWSL